MTIWPDHKLTITDVIINRIILSVTARFESKCNSIGKAIYKNLYIIAQLFFFFFFHIRESIYICWISGSGRSPWIDDDRSHVIIRYDGKTRVHEEWLAGGVIQKWLRLERSPDQDLIFHEEIETRVLCCGTTHIHSQCFCSLLVLLYLS
jgi:hypothetical protein